VITTVDDTFRREVSEFDLKCTCDSCGAFDANDARCAYGYPTEPHRHLPIVGQRRFMFCKAFELK
jgi:hypothetical protein